MNTLDPARHAALQDAFTRGVSTRQASIECHVARSCVLRYFKRFRDLGHRPPIEKYKPRHFKFTVHPHTAKRFAEEAMARSASTREIAVAILDAVARDGLFSALLDD